MTFGKEAEIFFPLTKLTVESRVRHVVLIEAALVTFGKEAEIFFPLTKLTVESRVRHVVLIEAALVKFEISSR